MLHLNHKISDFIMYFSGARLVTLFPHPHVFQMIQLLLLGVSCSSNSFRINAYSFSLKLMKAKWQCFKQAMKVFDNRPICWHKTVVLRSKMHFHQRARQMVLGFWRTIPFEVWSPAFAMNLVYSYPRLPSSLIPEGCTGQLKWVLAVTGLVNGALSICVAM